ncbi:MAG: hypothetical protein ACK4UN_09445, partial [Limisphaerales bacterium]
VRQWGAAFIMILIAAPFTITQKGGLWLSIGGRILCAIWAYQAAVALDQAPNTARDSSRLLDEAARLESADKLKAIALYEEVAGRYPNTPAAKEAERNIRMLKV